jgi:hypothetical protein
VTCSLLENKSSYDPFDVDASIGTPDGNYIARRVRRMAGIGASVRSLIGEAQAQVRPSLERTGRTAIQLTRGRELS